jgi:hypothetical protein
MIWLIATFRYLAVIWTSCDWATVVVSMLKLAVVEPAGTVTLLTAGLATSLFEVDSSTVAPPLGAPVVSVTCPTAPCCDCTLDGEIVKVERTAGSGGGVGVGVGTGVGVGVGVGVGAGVGAGVGLGDGVVGDEPSPHAMMNPRIRTRRPAHRTCGLLRSMKCPHQKLAGATESISLPGREPAKL